MTKSGQRLDKDILWTLVGHISDKYWTWTKCGQTLVVPDWHGAPKAELNSSQSNIDSPAPGFDPDDSPPPGKVLSHLGGVVRAGEGGGRVGAHRQHNVDRHSRRPGHDLSDFNHSIQSNDLNYFFSKSTLLQNE